MIAPRDRKGVLRVEQETVSTMSSTEITCTLQEAHTHVHEEDVPYITKVIWEVI